MGTLNLVRAVNVDMEIFEGDSVVFQLAFWQDDAETIAQDITLWKFVMDMKAKNNNCISPVSQSFGIGSGLTIAAPNFLNINAISTLLPGNYKQNIVGTDNLGIVTTWEYGNLKVKEKV